MAEAVLVDRASVMASDLAAAVSQSGVHQVARAVLVSDEGDWRLAVVSPDVERSGRLSVARRLHAAAMESGLVGEDISRLVVLGVTDPDSAALLTEGSLGRRGTLLEEMPQYRGYLLWRSFEGRRYVAEGVRAELVAALDNAGYGTEVEVRLPMGWRVDVLVTRTGWSAAVEIAMAEAKTWKSRLRDAAGVANLSGLPMVLVLVSPARVAEELQGPQGVVPVTVVDWREAGPPGVLAALRDLH